jgi:hypothetical protein
MADLADENLHRKPADPGAMKSISELHVPVGRGPGPRRRGRGGHTLQRGRIARDHLNGSGGQLLYRCRSAGSVR